MDAKQQPEKGAIKVQEAGELVRRLCVALTNSEMFSADHPLARKSVTDAYEWMKDLFQRRKGSIAISITNGNLIIDTVPMDAKSPLVVRLKARLTEMHVTSLLIEPDMSAEELQNFYRVVGKGAKRVNADGGLVRSLTQAGIKGVHTRQTGYVMLEDDEKVIAQTPSAQKENPFGLSSDEEIVHYMLGEVLKQPGTDRWLTDEMKKNPRRMASLIARGVAQAAAQSEKGFNQTAAFDSLLSNIRAFSRELTDPRTGEVKEGQQELQKAILGLETDLQAKSKQLPPSGSATASVDEIVTLVTSYSDRIRAKRLIEGFVQSDKSPEKIEELLKALESQSETPDRVLLRIRDLLLKRGMSEADFDGMVKRLQRKAKPAAAPVKPQKQEPPTMVEALAKRLKDLNLDESKLHQVVESLLAFIEERGHERAEEHIAETRQLQEQILARNLALDSIGWGIVLWTREGAVEFLNRAAQRMLGSESNPELTAALRRSLKEWPFPLQDPQAISKAGDLTEAEGRFSLLVSRVLTNEKGEIYSAILGVGATP